MSFKKIVKKFSQTHWLFVFIALISGVIIVSLTPPLWGADERTHFFRAYQVSEGRFIQNEQIINGKKSSGGYLPDSLVRLGDLSVNDISDNHPGDTKQVDNMSLYLNIGRANVRTDANVPNPFTSLMYPTVAYIAPSLGIFVANQFSPTALSLMYAARIATLLMYMVIVFLSIYIIRNKSVKWIIFAIALLPMSLYQASVVSPDYLLISLSLLFLAQIYRVFYDEKAPSNIFIALMFISAGLLSYVKPPYAILALPLLFLGIRSRISPRAKIIIKIVLPISCLIVAALVTYAARSSLAAPLPYTSFTEQLSWILAHPFGYIGTLINSITIMNWIPQIIGVFGTSFIYMPGPAVDILMVALVSAVYIKIKSPDDKEEVYHPKYSGIVFMLAGLITSLVVVTVLYLTWTPVGASVVEGVQGRYFIPALGFVLIGLRITTKARLVVTEKSARVLYSSVAIFALAYSLLWYYKVLY